GLGSRSISKRWPITHASRCRPSCERRDDPARSLLSYIRTLRKSTTGYGRGEREMVLPYALTERQQRFVALAETLAARCAERVAIHDRDGTFPFENYSDLHTSGYLRLAMPHEYGGEGANVLEMVLAQEHLARGDGATALATGMLVQIIGRESEAR